MDALFQLSYGPGKSGSVSTTDPEPAHHLLEAETRDAEHLRGPCLIAFRAGKRVAHELGLARVDPRLEAQPGLPCGAGPTASDLLGQLRNVDPVVRQDDGAAHLVLELPHVA